MKKQGECILSSPKEKGIGRENRKNLKEPRTQGIEILLLSNAN
jgi:hypothetical protein